MTKLSPHTHSRLQAPTGYKKLYEQEQHRRQNLERRVEALALERDALKWRLHVAQRRLLDKA